MKNDPLRDHFAEAYSGCDSPIESMLATALVYCIGLDMFERSQGIPLTASLPMCEIHTQQKVGRFKVDIALIDGDCKVAIECDVHDFHEKTKQQAARDKARDRTIVVAGYAVLRFTGSEIWADPMACAEEALQVIRQQQSAAAQAAYMAGKGN